MREEDMRMGGNKGNVHAQTEVAKQINVNSIRSNGKDKESGKLHYTGGRNYKQGLQKGTGPSQTTLNDWWKGKEKDLRSWSEEMDELDEIEKEQNRVRQESTLSYV